MLTLHKAACSKVLRRATLQALEGEAPTLPGCDTGSLEAVQLDLSSLASVRECIDSCNKRKTPLDILICNAGVMAPPERLEVPFILN